MNLIMYWKFTKNNIFIHLIENNSIVKTFSSGTLGFKNKRKKNPYAIKLLINNSMDYLETNNLITFNLIFSGISLYKSTILNLILNKNTKFNIVNIKEYLPLAYNGCKQKKKRRI